MFKLNNRNTFEMVLFTESLLRLAMAIALNIICVLNRCVNWIWKYSWGQGAGGTSWVSDSNPLLSQAQSQIIPLINLCNLFDMLLTGSRGEP